MNKQWKNQPAIAEINIIVVQNNIVDEFNVDAIVNTGNQTLSEGCGVSMMIYDKCGEELSMECYQLMTDRGFLPFKIGESVLTTSCNIGRQSPFNPQWIIHAIGPRWGGDTLMKQNLLKETINHVLSQAFIGNNFSAISMPAISSGINGFPKDVCANLMKQAIDEFKLKNPYIKDKTIYLCNIDHQTTTIFKKLFKDEPYNHSYIQYHYN